MSATTATTSSTVRTVSPVARRYYAISIGVTTLFIFFQSLTAGEFITEGLPDDAQETWTEIHGLTAYPIMVFALIAAIVAITQLRHRRALVIGTVALFAASVLQWLLGHAITTLHLDWVTPIHVVLAFVVYGLGIWLAVRAATLKNSRSAR